jgi:hypothetical protein
MLAYGSIFHKLPMILTSPAIVAAARAGALDIALDAVAGRRQVLEFAVLEAGGAEVASGRFEATPGGWREFRAALRVDDGQAAAERSEASARHGQRAMQIADVKFCGADGVERMHFSAGAAMRIKLRYRINRPGFSERPTILAAFQQNGVVRTHRFWTDDLLIAQADGAEGEIEIVADPLLLGAGTYFVTISVFQEGYLTSAAPKKFFAVSEAVYDMHARAYEIVVKPSASQPFCNDAIFQHPSVWYRNGALATVSRPHVDEPNRPAESCGPDPAGAAAAPASERLPLGEPAAS